MAAVREAEAVQMPQQTDSSARVTIMQLLAVYAFCIAR